RQAHLEGEPLIPVDRVEVPGGTGVAHQPRPVHAAGDGQQLGADGRIGGEDPHHSSPRTARLDVTVHTWAPPSSVISVRVVTMAIPPRVVMESTCTAVCSRSPATIGRW